MSKELSQVPTRRRFLGVSGAALAAAAMVPLANAQQEKSVRSTDHNQPNEEQPGENNTALDAENPSSVWSPETDNGTVEPFKYSFALATSLSCEPLSPPQRSKMTLFPIFP